MVTINLGEESSICSTCSECLSPFLKFSHFCHAVSTGDSRVTESDKCNRSLVNDVRYLSIVTYFWSFISSILDLGRHHQSYICARSGHLSHLFLGGGGWLPFLCYLFLVFQFVTLFRCRNKYIFLDLGTFRFICSSRVILVT